MRLSLDPDGAIAHTSQEWKAFTGLGDAETLGTTTMPMVHPDDQLFVRNIISSAVRLRIPYLVMFRIRRPGTIFSWVMCGGTPAFSPLRGACLGYLCDTEALATEPNPAIATDLLSDRQQSRGKVVMLDTVAEHVTVARKIAEHADERSLTSILDLALLSIGDMLHKSMR